MLLIILAGLLSLVAFMVLIKLLWVSGKANGPRGIIILAAAILLVGLAVLTATGRLHWIAALGAAVAPFLKRGLGLLRWLPWLRTVQGARSNHQQHQQGPPGAANALSLSEARDILGLDGNPSKDEIITAHRRLIQKLHPDRGGTTYLAQQLNEAKRVLLDHA